MGARTIKYILGARAAKYKMGARAGKHKVGARAGKYRLGAKARTRVQAEGRGLGNTNTQIFLKDHRCLKEVIAQSHNDLHLLFKVACKVQIWKKTFCQNSDKICLCFVLTKETHYFKTI